MHIHHGFYSVTVALMYNTISRTLYNDVKQEGLHSGPPGFKFIIFPSVFRTISFDDLSCLNKDGVVVELNIAFQYRVSWQRQGWRGQKASLALMYYAFAWLVSSLLLLPYFQ